MSILSISIAGLTPEDIYEILTSSKSLWDLCCKPKVVKRTKYKLYNNFAPSAYHFTAEQRTYGILYTVLELYSEYIN